MVYTGTKGDWPFLRTSFRLATGFNCKRVCHLCDVADSMLQLTDPFFNNHVGGIIILGYECSFFHLSYKYLYLKGLVGRERRDPDSSS